jgi:L,D-transpeptidase YcbB
LRDQSPLYMYISRITGLIVLSILLATSSCKQAAVRQDRAMKPRDTAITMANSYSEMFFDSTRLEDFLKDINLADTVKVQIREFYNVRNYQYAWFSEFIPNEHAVNFWNLQSNYIANTGDSSIFNSSLQEFVDSITHSTKPVAPVPEKMALGFELELTKQFFTYALKAYRGSDNLRPEDLKWYIPRRKVDVSIMLDSITKTGGKIESFEPVNRQYGLLRSFLVKYNQVLKSGEWELISAERKKYQLGDSTPMVAVIRKRLNLVGDLDDGSTSIVFDDSLRAAVKRFQQRYGLSADGVVGGTTLTEMNRPLIDRIRQLLVNMERIKWLPAEPSGDFLLVNIPEFMLHGYEDGKHTFKMNVVVGSTQNHTVIFTGKLKYVVFSPYWNVPASILKNEILPGIKRNPNYLAKQNMEWNGGQVRQKPGPTNSLGLVKFLFPNSYDIYLHDTPSKGLFKESRRAFSHGCIRLSEPMNLAKWVLRSQPEWTTESINKAMHANREKFVTVKSDINVFIGYFTAFVDRQGKLNFRDDIYGHDGEMEERMFVE